MPHAGIDKRMILGTLIEQTEAKLAELKAGYRAARDAVLSTPHVMKGKREVSGQESAYLANALALSIQERELELRTLEAFRPSDRPERVALGCLVGVGDADGAEEHWYFLLPVCGGMQIQFGGEAPQIRVVTPGTPVARSLMGRSIGDEVTLPISPPRAAIVKLLL